MRNFYAFVCEHADGWEQYWAYVNGNESGESKFLNMARCLEKFGSVLEPSARTNREKYEALIKRIGNEVTIIGVPFSARMIDKTVATRNLLTHGSSDPRYVDDEVSISSELLSLAYELHRFVYLVIMREIGFPMERLSIGHTRLVRFNTFSFEMDRADGQEEQIVDFNMQFRI